MRGRPRRSRPCPAARAHSNIAVGTLAAKIAPLELAIDENAPARVNILIPTIDLTHFFGGYITKLNLARRLAERGARVRIVTVDPVGPLPAGWQRTLESYSGLAGLFDRVEVAFGREAQGGRGQPRRPLRRDHVVDSSRGARPPLVRSAGGASCI